MKKTIQPAYIIIGTLLLTACGGEEGISYGTTGEGEKIIFHTSLPGVTSRATEIATDLSYFNLTAFNPADPDSIVDGFMRAYINNETITRTEGENTYTSDKCIWPAPGKEGDMTFFAYYPALNTGALTVNASRVTDGNTVVDYNITGFEVA
ncbi:MAG: fimbrillin family protein, partial [Muribaculaceae bacterium]|nr:fimbrillin family protein [Muribaculaceae bacterium]